MNINIKKITDALNRLSEMTIEVKERTGNYVFYSFIVRDVQV